MIKKPSNRNRFLTLTLGITLGIAAVLTLILLLVPAKEGRSAEAQGILLFESGESKSCSVSLQGTMITYTFDKDAPIYEGTLLLDGQEVDPVYLTFDGAYAAAGTEGVRAVMTQDMAIAAQITQDGAECLLLAPAPDEDTAQALLAQFLADTAYARQQGWEKYQK